MSATAPATTSQGLADGEGRPHRVVIIGTGFGGLFAAKEFKGRKDVEVTVLGSTNYHLFQPLLYQVTTGVLSEGEIAPAVREVLRRQENTSVLLGNVTDIDLAKREITSTTPVGTMVTPYDSLILAAGSGQSYFGNDQFAEFAPGMKSIDDALELRGRIFGAFELAELKASQGEDVEDWLTFVVVGAGATGVEMAGQIAELAHGTLRKDFRHINPRDARILLLDAAPAMLASFGERLANKARHRLERLGVEVRLGLKVVGMDESGVDVESTDGDKERIAARTKVWAAGVQASPLGKLVADQAGAETDRAGRVKVNPDTTLPGHPEVFVVGDLMSLDKLPGVAQVAMQSGGYAAKTIMGRLSGEPPRKPFHYFDKGTLATVSRFYAVADIAGLRFGGFFAWLIWLGVHIVYLIGFKNRVTTLLHWAVTFLARGRSERTATEQQVFARTALQRLARDEEWAREAAVADAEQITATTTGDSPDGKSTAGAPAAARSERG